MRVKLCWLLTCAVLGEVPRHQVPGARVVQGGSCHPERAPELPGPGQPGGRQEHHCHPGYPGKLPSLYFTSCTDLVVLEAVQFPSGGRLAGLT
jgi:hypothetical protein